METLDRYQLISAPLPAKTHSYQPVPHQVLIETIEEKLYQKDLKIICENFSANKQGRQMFGVFTVKNGNNEQNLNIGFRNSYDKSLPVGLVAGSTVIVCSNLMFKGDIKVLRKHTNGVFNDLDSLVTRVIENSLQQFEALQTDTRKLKELPMNRQQMGELAGRMFINDNIITATQMGIIKNEIHFSDHFREATKWDFYNHCTEALKISHPGARMQSQINLHQYVMERV